MLADWQAHASAADARRLAVAVPLPVRQFQNDGNGGRLGDALTGINRGHNT